MLSDLRYGVRQLLRSPGFAAVSIAALAIGIGANTAIFSVVNTLLIRPLPYADADRLAMVWEHNLVRNRPGNVVGPANFLHWRDMQQSFERLEAVGPRGALTLTDGEPEIVPAQLVTEGFIPLLGVSPARGRGFTPEEVRPGSNVLIISDRLWRRRFGSAPDILERTVAVNGAPSRVVGVMPEGFRFLAMSSLLYDTTPTDPLTFGAVAIGLVAVALAASYLPARRATRVDPAIALRGE